MHLGQIEAARQELAGHVQTTPVVEVHSTRISEALGEASQVYLKLELFQRAGSFKTRAAFLHLLALSADERERGVIAVSAGNHAIAVAYAARRFGCSAKIVMFRSANARRIELCEQYGATVILADTPHSAFEKAQQIAQSERRTLIHPFEGIRTALGTATVGLELCNQVTSLDAVIVPIGGGGLAAGVSCAVKSHWPHCHVYGVEPTGAPSMHRSFLAGSPQTIERIETIADSLGPPGALPISFELCRRYLSSVELVTDHELRKAMRVMQEDCRLAVEPAGAAALAALLWPLRDRLAGARIGLIVCGTNIDNESYQRLLAFQ